MRRSSPHINREVYLRKRLIESLFNHYLIYKVGLLDNLLDRAIGKRKDIIYYIINGVY